MADPRAVANGLVAQMSSGWGGSPRDLDYMRDQIERAVRDAQVEAMSCRALPASVRALMEAVRADERLLVRSDDKAHRILIAISAVLAEFPELKEDDRG